MRVPHLTAGSYWLRHYALDNGVMVSSRDKCCAVPIRPTRKTWGALDAMRSTPPALGFDYTMSIVVGLCRNHQQKQTTALPIPRFNRKFLLVTTDAALLQKGKPVDLRSPSV